ncbi:MAG: hypothetical protein MZU97_18105 [Bacillus subtilis]|nr:hypothetical protein [Bacillus subtilis]
MKKIGILWLGCFLAVAFAACSKTTTTTLGTDEYAYSALTLPNFSTLNPVRYLQVDPMGNQFDGWQDFGIVGEIQTNPWTRMTYTYQMYAYYLRNDLRDLYADVTLPDLLTDMPEWIARTDADGRRILWYSMGRLPESITILNTTTLSSNSETETFLRVEYDTSVAGVIEHWIIYFMETNDTFASYTIRVNESYEMVRDTTDMLVKTYRIKTGESE